MSIWIEKKKKKKKDDETHLSIELDITLRSPAEVGGLGDELWIGDTGVSFHMTTSL